MTVRPVARFLLVAGALLAGHVDAHPRPRPLPPALTRPPRPVGFAQLQLVLEAARAVTADLRAGPVLTTADGQTVVTLVASGQAVARVVLRADGTLGALPGGPVKPDATRAVPVRAGAADLDALVRQLTVSGAVQVTPAEYRVPLLCAGVVVAVLRLDRGTLRPRPDGPPRPPGPRGRGGG